MISRIPFNAVQQNVYQLLSAGQTVPTYDSVPTGPEHMPYIVLGEFHGSPVNENKTTVYHAVSQQIHVWTKGKGKKEVNDILDDVVHLLTKYDLNLNGYTQIGTATISQYQAYQELYADKTSAYHGVLSVEWVLQQEIN